MLERKDVEYLKGNQKKMGSELRRSGRIKEQESREQIIKGKERESSSPPDFAARKRKRGMLLQTEHSIQTDIARITLTSEDFANIQDDIITYVYSALKDTYRKSSINIGNIKTLSTSLKRHSVRSIQTKDTIST
jgi:hypothetical protein